MPFGKAAALQFVHYRDQVGLQNAQSAANDILRDTGILADEQ